jgi:hypothetical protein
VPWAINALGCPIRRYAHFHAVTGGTLGQLL